MTETLAPVVTFSQYRRLNYARGMRILVTGSRMWEWPGVIHHALDEATRHYGGEITIVHGQCDPRNVHGLAVPWDIAVPNGSVLYGADWHAYQYALVRGWISEGHPAAWDLYGKSAGHRRNAEMVKLGADLCLGFPLGDSPGTRGCLKLALDAHIPIRTFEG